MTNKLIHCEGDAFPCRHERITGLQLPDTWTYEAWGFSHARVRCGDCTTLARARMDIGPRIQRKVLEQWQKTY